MSGNVQAQEEIIRKKLLIWVKEEHKTVKDVEGMQFPKFGKIISNEFPICKGLEFEIGDIIQPMMNNYQKICKTINETKIPAIVLMGDSDLLPDLFERINSKGTQLSKYQIYAATWSSSKFELSSEFHELVKANRDRYDAMLEGNGTLEEYDPIEFMSKKELDTFEIAFGLGKYLCKTWPHLFGNSNKETQVESIGFTLLNCCVGMKNKDAKLLNNKLKDRIGKDGIDIFLKKILETIGYIDNILGKYSQFKSNSRKNTTNKTLQTEFQIVSIITSVFLLKFAEIERDEYDNIKHIEYTFDKVNATWKKEQEKIFKMNIERIYIMENLQRRWTGTGDKKMDLILTNTEYYIRNIKKDEFVKMLETWYENLNNERSEFKKIATTKESELLVIAALYLPIFSADQQMGGAKYDIEHLATQGMMKKHLDRFEGKLRLPISSIANLCLLPECVNRSKKDKTLYMDSEYLKKTNMSLEVIEQNYSFTKEEDLLWIEDTKSTMEEFQDSYMNFIDKRFNTIKMKLVDSLRF